MEKENSDNTLSNLPEATHKIRRRESKRVVMVKVPVMVVRPKTPPNRPDYTRRRTLVLDSCTICKYAWKMDVLGTEEIYCNRDGSCPIDRESFWHLNAFHIDAGISETDLVIRWIAERRRDNLAVEFDGHCMEYEKEPEKIVTIIKEDRRLRDASQKALPAAKRKRKRKKKE
jgi:hypothetical protein